MADRRDSKNRKLRKGEYQRADGRYVYKYKDHNGIDRWLYSWKLVVTDSVPEGKSCDICLRDIEMNALRANVDEINIYDADKVTLNQYFDEYMRTKNRSQRADKSALQKDLVLVYREYSRKKKCRLNSLQ